MKIVVLERNSVGLDVSVEGIRQLGEVVEYANTTGVDVKERIRDAEIIVANKAPLSGEVLKEAKEVKLICEFATGYDNVDLEYCKSRGIKVANVVNYSTDAVAQHTFALCLYVLEKLHHYDRYVKSGEYAAQERFSNFDIPYTELAGKTWGIVGMGKAIELVYENFDEYNKKLTDLRDYYISQVEQRIPYIKLNGHRAKRLPGNANISFRFVEGEALLLNLDMKGICASSGSACTSGSLDPSHVLIAIGLSKEIAYSSLRTTFGTDNTKEDIDFLVNALVEVVERLRNMSPEYKEFINNNK